MMEVISTRRYEARPPANVHSTGIIYDPENSIATVKEEEWETRKKKEITTTRQIETRVKRQVVLEDGEIVVDSGPLVTTNTTEDVEQQEHTTQERRTTGDEPQEVEWPSGGKGNGAIVQKELNETVVRSREEIQERLETEDRQQLGDISDEAYQNAVRRNRGDLRIALAESAKQLALQPGPRILQHTTRSNKVVDTENKLERSELKPDGLIVTESRKTVEHEEIKDEPLTEEDSSDKKLQDEATESRKESSQRFLKKRDEDLVDYVSGGEKIAREMRYVSETTEGERIGDWPPAPTTMRTTRLHKHTGFNTETTTPASRKDAVTKKPLDLEEEDEARKFETSKWLESHFGSESRSSHGSIDPDDPPIQTGTNTSFINVTMKSCTPARDREYSSPNYSSRHQQRRTSGRDSSSPSGYFHGISEWSERYQTAEKAKNHTRTASPSHYVIETSRSNGYKQDDGRKQQESSRIQKESTYSRTYEATRRQSQLEQDHKKNRHEVRQRDEPPSPPVRRRVREQQTLSRSEEKNSYNEVPVRTASPVLVVQRTWENRSKDVQQQVTNVERAETRRYSPQNGKTPPRSRSPSPVQRIIQPSRRETKKSIIAENPDKSQKSASHSKYKIGESFRKLVGKLRSASSERKNKRPGSSSTSQLTPTDDDSTYRQYNVIDRNIPLSTEDQPEDKPPERPPRSPRNNPNGIVKNVKTSRSNGYTIHEPTNYHRNGNSTPVHRYYVGEDPYTVSNRESYSREKVYREVSSSKPHGRSRGSNRNGVDRDYSVESNSLGRFSKSTSRLTNDYEREEQFRSAQTLPRKLHSVGHNGRTSQSNSRRQSAHSSNTMNHVKHTTVPTTSRSNQSRQYGSMINISIKNAVTSQKPNTTTNTSFQAPAKPERTYKSSLLRSKSFNVEANRGVNDNNNSSPNIPYKSNLQLNRLDETPPLKSPGILASISRSNRDLFKAAKHEY